MAASECGCTEHCGCGCQGEYRFTKHVFLLRDDKRSMSSVTSGTQRARFHLVQCPFSAYALNLRIDVNGKKTKQRPHLISTHISVKNKVKFSTEPV
jgi:hypothetical protein